MTRNNLMQSDIKTDFTITGGAEVGDELNNNPITKGHFNEAPFCYREAFYYRAVGYALAITPHSIESC